MKPGIIIALAFLPGGMVIWAAIWWRRRALDRARRSIDAAIVPPRLVYGKATTEELESIRATAERRRHAAEDKQRDAARIRSGQSVEERLRIVRGRG